MMTESWRLIFDPALDGATNMAVDEALLQSVGTKESAPVLRLFRWAVPTLSLGVAQPAVDADLERIKGRRWDIVRRLTGGRAILHTDEITYSVTLPADHPLAAGSIVESYRRLSAALLQALELLGMTARADPKAADAPKLNGPVCFEVPSDYEIAVDGRKMLGSAQVRKYKAVLQHGSLPLHGDISRICDALEFPDETTRAAAKVRVHQRAITLGEALGYVVTWEQAAEAFSRAFTDAFSLSLNQSSLTAAERACTEELYTGRYAADAWTLRL